jgi:hypothetical protein
MLATMKITVHRRGGPKPVTFSEFAHRHDLELEVRERPVVVNGRLDRWCCSFKDVEISEPGVLVSTSGNGDTIALAIADYAERLRGKRLVKNAWTPSRQEFDAPNEWAPEDFGALAG